MALTVDTSSGSVVITSAWTGVELGAIARVGTSEGYRDNGRIVPRTIQVGVWRAEDYIIPSRGDPYFMGAPYFGIVSSDIYRNIHAPIPGGDTTASYGLPLLRRTFVQSTRNNDGTFTNTFVTSRVHDFIMTLQPGSLSFTTLGATRTPANRYFSNYVCNGDWIVRVQEEFNFVRWGVFPNPVSANVVVSSDRSVAFTVSNRVCRSSRPLVPSSLLANAVSTTRLFVSWQRTGGVNVDYWQVRLGSGNWIRVNATSTAFSGLTPNTAYTISVRGVNSAGAGNAATTTATTQDVPPTGTPIPAPTVTASNIGQVSATINWVPGTPTATSLTPAKWEWSTDNATWTDVPGGASARSLDVENLNPGEQYIYYIRGVTALNAGGFAEFVRFTALPLDTLPQLPVLAEFRVERQQGELRGGGTSLTTGAPPLIVVSGGRPVVRWDTSPFVVPEPTIYEGATLPGTEDGRFYADEFDPLPLHWFYFPSGQSNSPQASVQVVQTVYDTAGARQVASVRTLQVVNNVATFTSTATTVATELNQFQVAGNTAGTNASSTNTPNGWGATPSGDGVGFYRVNTNLSATDAASPAQTSLAVPLDIVPYQGLRLGDISTYNAGAGLVGFECHYYARGITATTQARNNDVAFYKWAIYRRNAPENERPVAGTIREAGQTLVATGAHWVPTGWSMGYRQHAWQTARGQVAVVKTGLRNPNGTRLRVAFPSAETTGLLPNGDYTIRLRVIDIYGNQVGPQSFNFSVNRAGGTTTPVSTTLPPGSDAQTIAVVPVPRVYTADGTLTTTANTGLADVTTGLVPGQSIGLSVNVVGTVPSRDDLRDVVGSEGEVVNILVIQRREFSRVSGRDVDRSPRIVSGRIFINTIGGSAGAFFPTFRVLNDDGGVDAIFFDHQLESGVEYQYRCVWINKFSNRSYSTWVPA